MTSDTTDDKMTDEAYWRAFWKSFRADEVIPEDFHAEDLMRIARPYLEGLPEPKTCLEVGGFPGRNMIHAAKYQGFRCSLVDLVIEPEIIHTLEEANGLARGTITAIRADVTHDQDEALKEAFDLVTSGGFIEHFTNSEDILARHLYFLRPGGVLLITLPNLRGLTGSVLRVFGREEFDTHNLAIMDTGRLARIAADLGLKDIKSFAFYEDSAIFLPAGEKYKRGWRKIAFLPVRAVSKILERVKIPHAFFAPQICLLARKPL